MLQRDAPRLSLMVDGSLGERRAQLQQANGYVSQAQASLGCPCIRAFLRLTRSHGPLLDGSDARLPARL